MTEHNDKIEGLPENAYTELKDGETYQPLLPAHKKFPEINGWTITWGILMAAIFSAATAYLGLKIGQVFEAAIPIAIIAVGASTLAKRKNPLSENVIIQSIGASSGVIVAGAIFTLPAIYIIGEQDPVLGAQMEISFFQIFIASLLGGFLGILFLIPFRKYFVSDMHGKFPFPEATATTEILVSGNKGGTQAKLILISGLIGGLYDFCISTFGLWAENITSKVIPAGVNLASKVKMEFKMNTTAAVVGIGYIVGLKYALIICCGSFLAWWVLVPLMGEYGIDPNTLARFSTMNAETIFKDYVRLIGIGGIAMAGIIGVVKSLGVIKSAFGPALKGSFSKKSNNSEAQILRTQKDLSMKIILFGLIACVVMLLAFFLFGVKIDFVTAIVGLLVVFLFAFLFTTVAANAIAIVGNNPVSGMTIMTLILSSFILSKVGLSGASGTVAALLIGGVVCSALAMAGGFITDLKIGYWIGSSPYKQQLLKFLGTAVSALTAAGVIILLSKTYGYIKSDLHPNPLEAPQANAMAAIIKPLMLGGKTPWMLYIVGAILALILDRLKIPALAFSLGMFLPMHITTGLLLGGFVSHIVATCSKDEVVNKTRKDRGILIASGLMAGGALFGILSAVLDYFKMNLSLKTWVDLKIHGVQIHEVLGFVMVALLCTYIVWDAFRAKKAD